MIKFKKLFAMLLSVALILGISLTTLPVSAEQLDKNPTPPPSVGKTQPDKQTGKSTDKNNNTKAITKTPPKKDYVISWKDDIAESAVRTALSKPTGDIKRSDLDFITDFGIYDNSRVSVNGKMFQMPSKWNLEGLKNVLDLKHFQNVEKMELYYHKGIDLTDFPVLSSLTSLDIVCEDVKKGGEKYLGKLTNLTYLCIAFLEPANLDFTQNLTKLKELDISYCEMSSISSLAGHPTLQIIWMGNNPSVTDVSSLNKISSLNKVTLNMNTVKNYKSLNNRIEVVHIG